MRRPGRAGPSTRSPTATRPTTTFGLACLGTGRFGEAWEHYQRSIGIVKREERIYGDEIRWMGPEHDRQLAAMGGEPTKALMIYGEQGIGDEMLFSSMVPDVLEDGPEEVIVECMPRTEGLFRRSFPKAAAVIGTRYQSIQAQGVDARVSMAVLGQWYRREIGDFDRPPHLMADPERRRMVRGLLDGLPGSKKIGIAWTGGLPNTKQDERSAALPDIYEQIQGMDATFISLEYKGDGKEALRQIAGMEKVRHFPNLVNTQDYDDTAALVAELDGVISVTTSVVHLAGGLGIPVFILVPEVATWKYSHITNPGEDFYWWRSAKLIRAEGGRWDLTRAREFFG